jgi:hypothetical protein
MTDITTEWRREELDDIKSVAGTRSGRRFLWRLLAMANVFSESFNPDPYTTAYNEGRRIVGLTVLNDLMEAAPEKFISMQRGAKEREQNHERRIADLDGDGGNDY